MTDDTGPLVSRRRSGQTTTTLNPEAEAFFRTIPTADYPSKLIESFPRIANQIVAVRSNKAALCRYFESLLVDERGGRCGFDFSVLVEIQNLFERLVGIPSGFSNTNSLVQDQRKK